MNQLTTIELAKQAGVVPLRIDGLEAFRALVIEAEHKRLLGVGMKPAAWRHSHTYSLHDLEHEVQLADADASAEPLYTADQLAAARLQDQQARQQAQIENESLKARIARADVEKAREVFPLKKRIAELEAQLAESGYSACDMATAAAQGFRDGMSQSK